MRCMCPISSVSPSRRLRDRFDAPDDMLSIGESSHAVHGSTTRRISQCLENSGLTLPRARTILAHVPNVDGAIPAACKDVGAVRRPTGLVKLPLVGVEDGHSRID